MKDYFLPFTSLNIKSSMIFILVKVKPCPILEYFWGNGLKKKLIKKKKKKKGELGQLFIE